MRDLLQFLIASAAFPALAACQAYAQPEPPAQHQVAASTSDSGARVSAQAYAEAACGSCHAVEAPWISPNPRSPPFVDIANREGLDETTLGSWLKDAHNYPEQMDFDLDTEHAEALADYMAGLRNEKYRKPPS